MLKRIDWLHVASLAVFLDGLQYVLEEGPRHEWFTDEAVLTAAWLSFVGAVVFFERTFFSTMPVVKLTPFKRPTFAMACVLNVVIGFGLYAATYLTPVFLGRVREFSSLQIGTDGVRHRHRHDRHRAHRRAPVDPGGRPLRHRRRLHDVRGVAVDVQPRDARVGLLGAVLAAGRCGAWPCCSASCRRWAWR